jgi:hypothetical protein
MVLVVGYSVRTGARTGDRADVYRTVRRAVRRDHRTAINRMGVRMANCRTFLVY